MRKSGSLLLASAFLLSSCSSNRVVVKHVPEAGRKVRVAVLPFKDAPGAPGSGQSASDALTSELLKIPSYEIIERGAMDQLMKEQNLSLTGAISQQTAASLGQLLGADALVVGAVTEYQERDAMIFPPAKAGVSARMVSAASGTVEWSGGHSVGWHPVKWISCIFWPLGAFWLVTSPSVEDRLGKASRGLAAAVAAQTSKALHQKP